MTSLSDPLEAPIYPDESARAAERLAHEPPPSPAIPAADEPRIHLYEAVSVQRDKVLNSFDAQRAAILKAVADQRTAALAPIAAVNVKRATQERAPPTKTAALSSPRNIDSASSNSTIKAGGRRRLMIGARQAIAAQIVGALRMLVAAEVRAQLAAAPLASPGPDERSRSASGDTEPAAGRGDLGGPSALDFLLA